MAYEILPWDDSTNWLADMWYPLAYGTDIEGITDGQYGNDLLMDGYLIYRLTDEDDSGDITPIIGQPMALRDAIEICQEHNKMSFPQLLKMMGRIPITRSKL